MTASWSRAWPIAAPSRGCDYYGQEQGAKVEHAEAFEICEYGHQPGPAEIRRLFPFFEK